VDLEGLEITEKNRNRSIHSLMPKPLIIRASARLFSVRAMWWSMKSQYSR
jgi:hypothetical protein